LAILLGYAHSRTPVSLKGTSKVQHQATLHGEEEDLLVEVPLEVEAPDPDPEAEADLLEDPREVATRPWPTLPGLMMR
jgi:hypothetical protein